MKSLFTILTLLAGTTYTLGQNLLSNPNFSLHSACPSEAGEVYKCNNWFDPTLATSDYFHQCAVPSGLYNESVPSNWMGYQPSLSNAYLGFFTYCGLGYPPNTREYVATSFAPLIVGGIYKVTITISLADSFGYACDGFGVFFSTQDVHTPALVYTLPVSPQIDYTSYGVINDKNNWITLSKNFIADSAYKYLVIGAFINDADQNRVATSFSKPILSTSSYYYLDSAALEKVGGVSQTSNINTANSKATLYPNPFKDNCIVSFENNAHVHHLYIYDIQGRLLRQINDITGGNVTIERGTFPSGFYYYKLYEENNIICCDKFLIDE